MDGDKIFGLRKEAEQEAILGGAGLEDGVWRPVRDQKTLAPSTQ